MSTETPWRIHVRVDRYRDGTWLGACRTRHVIRGAKSEDTATARAVGDAIELHMHHHDDEDDVTSLASVEQSVPMPKDPKTVSA